MIRENVCIWAYTLHNELHNERAGVDKQIANDMIPALLTAKPVDLFRCVWLYPCTAGAVKGSFCHVSRETKRRKMRVVT